MGWAAGILGLFMAVFGVSYYLMMLLNPTITVPAPAEMYWPQVVRTVDGVLTTPMPENLDEVDGNP